MNFLEKLGLLIIIIRYNINNNTDTDVVVIFIIGIILFFYGKVIEELFQGKEIEPEAQK